MDVFGHGAITIDLGTEVQYAWPTSTCDYVLNKGDRAIMSVRESIRPWAKPNLGNAGEKNKLFEGYFKPRFWRSIQGPVSNDIAC